VKEDSGMYILQAGSVHGVTKGSQFSLYREKDRDGAPLDNVKIVAVNARISLIESTSQSFLSLDTSSPIYAVQLTFANVDPLRVYLDSDPRLNQVCKKLKEAIKVTPHLYTILDSPEKAQLEVGIQDDTATFITRPALLDRQALGRLPYRVNLNETDKIFNAINAASLFDRYLSIHPPELKTQQQLVQVDFFQLEKQDGDWKPLTPGTVPKNLNNEGHITVVNGSTRYGIRIENKSNQSLYPYLFLFNCSDLSIGKFLFTFIRMKLTSIYIELYYDSPSVKGLDQDAPLQPTPGNLTVGYGDGGGQPWRHVVKPTQTVIPGAVFCDGQDLEVEFFKLILTTQPVNLSFMEQISPFGKKPRALRDAEEPADMWAMDLVTVITNKQ
jgi:hypothetical protein